MCSVYARPLAGALAVMCEREKPIVISPNQFSADKFVRFELIDRVTYNAISDVNILLSTAWTTGGELI